MERTDSPSSNKISVLLLNSKHFGKRDGIFFSSFSQVCAACGPLSIYHSYTCTYIYMNYFILVFVRKYCDIIYTINVTNHLLKKIWFKLKENSFVKFLHTDYMHRILCIMTSKVYSITSHRQVSTLCVMFI